MKRTIALLLAVAFCLMLIACGRYDTSVDIAATTLPVYELTAKLCEGTGLKVNRIIAENVSCLHDYTLQPGQMKALEQAQLTILSGAGLEEFMEDVLSSNAVDASQGIELLCPEHHHDHEDQAHDHDPHFWLSPENGKIMTQNIYIGLCEKFPLKTERFAENYTQLIGEFDKLIAYGQKELSPLSCKELITFHDGFAYMAESYGLRILHAMEEESGSEASAKELIEICKEIQEHEIPAVFTEKNGSSRAATIVSKETGAKVYTLDMGMSDGYFTALYHNIDTLKEALG